MLVPCEDVLVSQPYHVSRDMHLASIPNVSVKCANPQEELNLSGVIVPIVIQSTLFLFDSAVASRLAHDGLEK